MLLTKLNKSNIWDFKEAEDEWMYRNLNVYLVINYFGPRYVLQLWIYFVESVINFSCQVIVVILISKWAFAFLGRYKFITTYININSI